MANMATGVFRLKGSTLRELGRSKGVKHVNQISLRSGVSYPTTYRYIEKPEQVGRVDLRALYGIMVDGFGMTSDEIGNLRVGDLLEMIPDTSVGAD